MNIFGMAATRCSLCVGTEKRGLPSGSNVFNELYLRAGFGVNGMGVVCGEWWSVYVSQRAEALQGFFGNGTGRADTDGSFHLIVHHVEEAVSQGISDIGPLFCEVHLLLRVGREVEEEVGAVLEMNELPVADAQGVGGSAGQIGPLLAHGVSEMELFGFFAVHEAQ